MVTEEYAPGRLLDVHGDGGPVVLLWHGRGASSRQVLARLGELAAGHGLTVVIPDYDPGDADGGRSDLLRSLRWARDTAVDAGQDPDTITIAGWSLGGVAALGLALVARRLGVGVGHLVLVAPADGPRAVDPFSEQPLPTPMRPGAGHCHVDVVYGEADTITPPDMVCGLELRLRSAGWSTSLHAVDGDHGEIVGATYDERRDAFVPSSSTRAVHDATLVADILAAAATSSPT